MHTPLSGQRLKRKLVRTIKQAAPLLWRIEYPDRHSTARSSYIFGTIHIDDKNVMAVRTACSQRLVVADTLMLELELNDLTVLLMY